VRGFTADVPVRDLAGLCHDHGVPLLVDIGSGLLTPDPLLPDEPDAHTALRHGADLVTASGDKLLGGPQCGLLLGRADLVERLRRHPLARALRVDKLTLGALEATLRGALPPVRQMLAADAAAIRRRAGALVEKLSGAGIAAEAVSSEAAVGGGGAPGVILPSAALRLPAHCATPLRQGDPPVIGRLERDGLLLDLRTVDPADDDALLAAVRAAAER
jgi:L-seryl-tRNA(Ser) seleniumtransferase